MENKRPGEEVDTSVGEHPESASRSPTQDAQTAAPKTVIVVHPREKRKKCTVAALRGHDDFHFVRFPKPSLLPLEGYVRLGIGGPEISSKDRHHGLLILDGTWKLAQRMEPFYKDLPLRSLPALKTAYPRSSKYHDDPQEGLATIEALYAALRLMGRNTEGVLDHYYWKKEFLALNPEL